MNVYCRQEHVSPDTESFNCPKTSLLEGFVTPIFHVVYLISGLQTRSMPKAHAALIHSNNSETRQLNDSEYRHPNTSCQNPQLLLKYPAIYPNT